MQIDPASRRFLGVWRLEAIRDSLPDGRVVDHPDFGPDVDGFLVYTDSGHVFVQFMRRERSPWRGEDDPSDAERAEAARGYGAYAGRFEVDESSGAVLHHVEVALIPNRVGTMIRRTFSFAEDSLTLSAPPFQRNGIEVGRSLTWKKVA